MSSSGRELGTFPFATQAEKDDYEQIRQSGYLSLRIAHEAYMKAVDRWNAERKQKRQEGE